MTVEPPRRLRPFAALAPLLAACVVAQEPASPPDDLEVRLREALTRIRERVDAPGMSAAVSLPDGRVVAVAAGVRELGEPAPLLPTDRMFCGSVGKTWFAAVALELVAEGRLSLDDRVADHLGDEPWFAELPNHDAITVRNLMRHDSGLPRWIEQDGALRAWAEQPVWKNGEQLRFVRSVEPLHPAGEGWAYSDTNYIVLGLVVERLAGRPIYDLVQQRLIARHDLDDTLPGDRREIEGLVQGHLKVFARFGFGERALVSGLLAFDPSAEWCGGGVVTSAPDLARWARVWAKPAARLRDAVPADALGRGTRYGLGVMLRDSELGPTRGHDGIFLGYAATMRWFERHDVAVAVLANFDAAARAMPAVAVALAKVVVGGE